MATLLADLGDVAGDIFTTIGMVCTTVVDEPLLLLTVGFLFVGGCVGIFGRLLSRG